MNETESEKPVRPISFTAPPAAKEDQEAPTHTHFPANVLRSVVTLCPGEVRGRVLIYKGPRPGVPIGCKVQRRRKMAEGLCRGRGRGRGALAHNMQSWKPFGEPSDLQNNNVSL